MVLLLELRLLSISAFSFLHLLFVRFHYVQTLLKLLFKRVQLIFLRAELAKELL
jgi:hypothetical protein